MHTCNTCGMPKYSYHSTHRITCVFSHSSALIDIHSSVLLLYYLQCFHTSVVMSNVVHNFQKCYINAVTWMFSWFYWYISTLPLEIGSSRAYISVKPLTAILQYINVCMYVHTYCMYVDTFYTHHYICMCTCMHACIHTNTHTHTYTHTLSSYFSNL